MNTASRHGVALLMAVATLVLVLAGTTAGLVALRGARQSAWTRAVDGRLLAGLRAGETLAAAWLKHEAANIVLPPAGGGILLVDDGFALPDGRGRLTVTAYDGLAGIPGCLAQRGSALRAALPADLSALAVPPIDAAQADQAAYLVDCLEVPADTARFPAGLPGTPRLWRIGPAAGFATAAAAPEPAPSLAEAIAVRSDGRINLNTAPEPLLRAAYAALGLAGIDAALERRRLLLPGQPPGGSAGGGLRLVARSDRWQMLIEATWQDIRRSWWVDFSITPQGPIRMQRHDASH